MAYLDGAPTPDELLAASQAYYSAAPTPEPNMSTVPEYFSAAAPAAPPPVAPPVPAYWGGPAPAQAPAGAPSAAPDDPFGIKAASAFPAGSPGPVLPASAPSPAPAPLPAPRGDIEVGPMTFSEPSPARMGPLAPKVPAMGQSSPTAPAAPADRFGVDAAQQRVLGTYDAERDAIKSQADAEATRAVMRADGMRAMADQQQADAYNAQAEALAAKEHFDAQLAEQRKQLDDLASRRIDPNRIFADAGAGTIAIALVGTVLGGIYQGERGGSNPFLEQMNKLIDRDIDAQTKDLANARGVASERMNLLGQQRAIFHDEQMAKLQARNLMLESMKTNIEAKAAEFDQPIIQARAQQATAAIGREQAKVDMQFKAEARRVADARAAAQFAASKAARSEADKRALEARKTYESAWEKALAAGATPAQAEAEARRLTLTLHGGGAGPRPEGEAPFGKQSREDAKDLAKEDADRRERFVATGKDERGNPTGYLAANPSQANDIREQRKMLASLEGEVDNAIAIRKEAGRFGRTVNREGYMQPWPAEWQTKIRQSESAIIGLINKSAGLGAIDSGSLPLLYNRAGNLETRGDDADIRLQGMKEFIARSRAAIDSNAAGAAATKVVSSTGKEVVLYNGGQNAPLGARPHGRPVR